MSRPIEPISVPALDLKAQYRTIRGEIEGVVREVIENQAFVLGPEVAGLEEEVARYPSRRNVADMPDDDGWAYEPGTVSEAVYFQTRLGRRRKLRLRATS